MQGLGGNNLFQIQKNSLGSLLPILDLNTVFPLIINFVLINYKSLFEIEQLKKCKCDKLLTV